MFDCVTGVQIPGSFGCIMADGKKIYFDKKYSFLSNSVACFFYFILEMVIKMSSSQYLTRIYFSIF